MALPEITKAVDKLLNSLPSLERQSARENFSWEILMIERCQLSCTFRSGCTLQQKEVRSTAMSRCRFCYCFRNSTRTWKSGLIEKSECTGVRREQNEVLQPSVDDSLSLSNVLSVLRATARTTSASSFMILNASRFLLSFKKGAWCTLSINGWAPFLAHAPVLLISGRFC